MIYFPVPYNSSRDLCAGIGAATNCALGPTSAPYANTGNPYEQPPCAYVITNHTSTTDSGPYIVSGGHTFYKNRAYISIDAVSATNGCSQVGRNHTGSILTLQSSDVYSVMGYHHEFQDIGHRFNFADLTTVPSAAYYASCGGGADCEPPTYWNRFTYHTDYLNGNQSADFGTMALHSTQQQYIWDQAYFPTLLMPTQIRSLDPAWFVQSMASRSNIR